MRLRQSQSFCLEINLSTSPVLNSEEKEIMKPIEYSSAILKKTREYSSLIGCLNTNEEEYFRSYHSSFRSTSIEYENRKRVKKCIREVTLVFPLYSLGNFMTFKVLSFRNPITRRKH